MDERQGGRAADDQGGSKIFEQTRQCRGGDALRGNECDRHGTKIGLEEDLFPEKELVAHHHRVNAPRKKQQHHGLQPADGARQHDKAQQQAAEGREVPEDEGVDEAHGRPALRPDLNPLPDKTAPDEAAFVVDQPLRQAIRVPLQERRSLESCLPTNVDQDGEDQAAGQQFGEWRGDGIDLVAFGRRFPAYSRHRVTPVGAVPRSSKAGTSATNPPPGFRCLFKRAQPPSQWTWWETARTTASAGLRASSGACTSWLRSYRPARRYSACW